MRAQRSRRTLHVSLAETEPDVDSEQSNDATSAEEGSEVRSLLYGVLATHAKR